MEHFSLANDSVTIAKNLAKGNFLRFFIVASENLTQGACQPILGSTPVIIEKAIASEIRARATTEPAKRSTGTLKDHSRFNIVKLIIVLLGNFSVI
jgi:hypothetical protein